MAGMKRRSGWTGSLVAALLLLAVLPASASADVRRWYLNNANDASVGDIAISYGDPSQVAVPGDWDGNGTDTPGVYSASAAQWWLSNGFTAVTAQHFTYGNPGYAPVAGDWDGNHTRTVGAVTSAGRWYLSNVNGPVVGSVAFNFGSTGDVWLSGDWNGDGKETPGIYHRATAQFWLSNQATGACCDKIFVFGNVGDTPVVGDWNGDGVDTVGVVRATGSGPRWFLNNANDGTLPEYTFYYGNPGDTPVTGDWDGNRTDTAGVVRTIVTATGGTPAPPDPFPTSTRYGGANKSVDTEAEADALLAAATATDAAGQEDLWDGLKDEDQGYVAMTRGGDPELTLVSTEEELDTPTIFESQDLEGEAVAPPPLGDEPTEEPTPEPTAEPTPEPTAEPTPDPDGDGTVEEMSVSRCKRIKWTYELKIPLTALPDLHPGNAIHRVRFCFNKKRKTTMYGGTNLIEEDLNTKGTAAGVSVDPLEAPTPYHEEWNGARRGQIHIERPWKLTWCRAACVLKHTYHAVKWGHYDGTWVDRSY